MKKYLVFMLLVVLLIPLIVFAESCDTNSITIETIELVEKTDTVEELTEATSNGNNIKLDLSMSEVGNTAEYKVILKNNSNKDYEIDESKLNINSDYFEYSFETEDDSNVVKANSSKVIYLTAEYKSEIPIDNYTNGIYNDQVSMKMDLSADEIITNPNTKMNYIILVLVVIIVGGLFILQNNKKLSNKLFLIGILLLIPFSIKALCKYDITVNANITVDKNEYYYGYNEWSLSDNFEDALSSWQGGPPFTFRIAVFNNNTTSAYMAYKIDGKLYHTLGGEIDVDFEARKQELINIFGEENCNMTDYGLGPCFTCFKDSIRINIYDGNGFVGMNATNNPYWCHIYRDNDGWYSMNCDDD